MLAKPIVIFSYSLFASLIVCAGAAVTEAPQGLGLLRTTLAKYRSVGAIKSLVEKKVELALLEETKESKGHFLFSKKYLKLDLTGEERSLIVMQPQMIWVETTSKDESIKPQVLKITSKDLSKKNKAPIALLLGDDKILQQFKLLSEKVEAGRVVLTIEPKVKESFKDLQKVEIEINRKEKLIYRLQYEDENGNKTAFRFSEIQVLKTQNKNDFKYTPPSNAELSILN